MFKFFLIIFLCISQCFSIDVQPVKKGDTVAKDGFFIDPDNMKILREINEIKKKLEKENKIMVELRHIDMERIKVNQERSKELEKEITKERIRTNWKGIGGFILGVAATSLAAYAAIRITK